MDYTKFQFGNKKHHKNKSVPNKFAQSKMHLKIVEFKNIQTFMGVVKELQT